MKKDLPIYDIKLSDDTQGVGFISLVDEPAIGVDWIKLAKVTIKQEPKKVNSMMAKRVTKVNSMMAKKALGTLDGSGCFGCPPNGDGTRVNGEPDGRCKGDGSGKEGGGGRGTSTSKSPVINAVAKYETEDSIKNNYNTISRAEAREQGKMPGIYSKTEQNVSIKSENGQDYVVPLSWAKKIAENGLYENRDGGKRMTSGSLFAKGQLRINSISWSRRNDGAYTIAVSHSLPGFGGGAEYAKL